MAKDITWALVINATTARIVRGLHKDAPPDAPELVITTDHKDLREIMADKPGRSYASVGTSRSAMEYASDPVRDAERAFVLQALAILDLHRLAGDFQHLVVAAGPEMLGMVRDVLPKPLAALVSCEINKNLLHESVQDLTKHLAALAYPT